MQLTALAGRCSQKNRRTTKKLLKIMKLTAILLLTACMQVAARSDGQTVSLSLKNAPMKQVFREIQKQTGLNVLVDESLLEKTGKVTLKVHNVPLEEALDLCLRNQPLSYTIEGGAITIKTRPVEILQPVITPVASIEVKGTVTDEKGVPLAGASVKLKGAANIGTNADANGNFTLQLPDKGGVLIVSYVGYQTNEIPVSKAVELRIVLKQVGTKIDEVVVIGYGSVKKSDLTGAVSSIKKADLPQGASASIGQMLSGRAPGVTVRNTNALPGGGVEILIRGATSTSAGNEPLFVIDGFPITNNTLEPGSGASYYQGDRSPLNSINPDDIESIEVLKDASASAIYGARAANGVVLITTRRGKAGVSLTYNGQNSNQQIKKPFEMLNATQYMEETNKIIKEKWLRANSIAPFGTTAPNSVSPWIPRFTNEQIANAGEGTNWWKLITRTGAIQNHNVALSGGSDKVKTYASLGYFGQDGVLKNSRFERFTGKLNLDYKVNNILNAGISLLATSINNSNLQIGEGQWENSGMIMSALLFDPTLPVKNPNGTYTISPWYVNMPNPVSYLDVDDHTKQTRLLTNVFAEITPLKNLKIRTSLGADAQGSTRKTYYPQTFLFGYQKGGQASINQINRNDYLFDFTANYSLTQGDHAISLLGGYAYQQFNDDSYGMTATKFFSDVFTYNNMAAASNRPFVSSGRNRSILGSYFSRVNYSFKGRYLLTLNARYDGSDRFGVNNKWGFFPSAALAWKVSDESFIQGFHQLSNLKLRFSYGQTGNSNIGANAFSFYDVNRTFVFNNEINVGALPVQLANPNLKWETTTSANLGIDFGFFNNRVTGVVEVYKKEVSDLLGFKNLRSWMLLPSVAANLGKTQSRGLEIGITTVNIDNQRVGFKWSTTVNYTTYKDRWKERSPDVVLNPWEKMDDPIRPVFTYTNIGILQPGETYGPMPFAVPGNMKVKDINGFDANLNYTGKPDGKIDQADMVLRGSVDPKFTLGINNTVKYKSFDLSVYAYGMFDRWIYNQSLIKYIAWSDKIVEGGTNLRVEALNRWSSTNLNGKYPSDAINQYPGNDSWVWEKASFFRIKNITLGYDLSQRVLKKAFKSIRVFADVQNPIVFTNWSGMDPETDGGSIAPYPNQVSYTFGVNIVL